MNITRPFEEIEKMNASRQRDYFRVYNPIIGDPKGEIVERVPVVMDGTTFYIPKDMQKEPIVQSLLLYGGDTVKVAKMASLSSGLKVRNEFLLRRLDYDFEYFVYLCSPIEDKRSGEIIKFFLNKGQRLLVKEFEKQRLSRLPIRVVLVKARQFGGSTVIERYMQWLQLHVKKNWHSAIVSAVQDQSINLRADYENALANLPPFHPKVTIKNVTGSQVMRYIPERGCKIKVTSAEKPNTLRSFSLKAIHMTECGNWPDTKRKSGNDVAQAVYNTVPDEPDTFIALESTALGTGNFFHKQYQIAKANKSEHRNGLQPAFVPFFMIDRYNTPIKDLKQFIEGMSTYNWWQWKNGATLEGINWYNIYKSVNKWTDFQMKSEFPTTADEAFQSSSGRYFTDRVLSYLQSGVSAPKFTGDIRGNGIKGKESLQNLELIPNDSSDTDCLKVWIMPDDYIDATVNRCTNRFIVTVDIGGTHYKSDWSVISVFDRLGLMSVGGALERAALWRGHIDHDLLAWKAAQIATFYNKALLVVESNTIETRDRKYDENHVAGGQHFFTVLTELIENYPNMYMRESAPDKITGLPTMKIGYHMNKLTKYQTYDKYTFLLREHQFIEHDEYAVTEAGYMETKADGTLGNIDGEHDDVQDTNAIASYVGTHFKDMPMPQIIPIEASDAYMRIPKAMGGVSTF